MQRKLIAIAAVFLITGMLGCARPVGVLPANEKTTFRILTASALSDEHPSSFTGLLLARLGLDERYAKNPADTLAELRNGLGGADEPDRLFALAELSYLQAKKAHDPRDYLASAVYAYIYLFPDDPALSPSPYDPRLRLAMNLYNRAIANGLRAPKGDTISLDPRQVSLPFGILELKRNPANAGPPGYQFTDFHSVQEYEIYGLRNHYRKPGIGAPLIASVKPVDGQAPCRWISPHAKSAITAFVRFDQPRRALRNGRLAGQIELYEFNVASAVDIDGHSIPLECDTSAALAYALDHSPLWDFELAGFRRGDFSVFRQVSDGDLFFSQPYQPGLIPVVLVHGTASSPARWAEIFNEMLADRRITTHYQFWYYIYNSGNPIAVSAMQLRDRLQEAVKELDPSGKDPALHNMVVIGHSQGGLVTKMTVVSSGARFWNLISEKPFEETKMSSGTKNLLGKALFVEPLPFVKRVVFIATPHHGCQLVENFLGNIIRRLVTLPAALTKAGHELVQLNSQRMALRSFRMPTAIDNMRSSNPFLRTLASLPINPGVSANSIIAVKGKGPPEKDNDGVVSYASAHHEGVESELVVRGGHSCQSLPPTIEEVRRILYLHAGLAGSRPLQP